MKVPMSWFNDYTDISGVTPKEYNDALTMTGSKVETIESLGADIKNVVTGRILEITDHPDSDHMVICKVDVGDEVLQIVTGAPNVKAGQIVPVAKNDSYLPGGVHIKTGKLRGVESCGMLCSHEELGLSESDLSWTPEYGILILPEDTKVGVDIKDIFGLNENVVEFEITSNRPDCFSVIGLARETAATFKKPFSVKKPKFTENSENIADTLSVTVENPEKCLRYCARMVKNVKIEPSPAWLARRLKASGIRPINNIVDITNYILLEYGQPMHAFDLRHISGEKIVVRNAGDGEIIKTLDEQDRELNHNDLVIADAEKAVAIAGVMGGFNSEIEDDTTTVVFESATFDAVSVRLTAQKAGLRTEASSRYEKGLDPNNTVPAVERACELVEMLGCGENVGGMIDVKGNIKPRTVLDFRPDKINAFLGINISKEEMAGYLKALEFDVDLDTMKITAPSFRPDIEAEADIAEEIARFYGYDKIPTTPISGEATKGYFSPLQKFRKNLANALIAQGMNEIFTFTFTSPAEFDKLELATDSPLRNAVKISNPLGEDTSIMRTTTLSSMLETMSYNYNRKNDTVSLYEISKVFIPTKDGELPDEPEMLTVGMYRKGMDFFDIKGILEAVFDSLNIKGIEFKQLTDNPTFHPGRTAAVTAGGSQIGVVGEIHPSVSDNFDIGVPCYAAEINIADLFACVDGNIKFKPLPKFPAAERDIAVLVDKSVAVGDLRATMVKAAGALLDSIKLFDVYEGDRIPEGKKSVAFAITFRAPDRSLTNDEVNRVFNKIVKDLQYKNDAHLR
ncbi:MAG: phenylalanine--tRNA ligase subunit beta [Clostridiales bacterium]|nr:phenylalanine--tRNA ligase subunit beta [Clostridiales bacterium]